MLEELRWPAKVAPESIAESAYPTPAEPPDGPQTALLEALGADPVGLDALMARTGLDTATLQARLLELELDGHVGRLPGGLFQRLGRA